MLQNIHITLDTYTYTHIIQANIETLINFPSLHKHFIKNLLCTPHFIRHRQQLENKMNHSIIEIKLQSICCN